jgi:NAD(P)-dependent dehydrogenase (short-subunit alcohol dehydrogenase family)
MSKLENRVSLNTGAASGIGAATAKLFAAEGATVIVVDNDESNGRRVAEEIGARGIFHKANMSEPLEVEAMVKLAVDRFGRLDVLHNNVATAGAVAPVGDMPIEAWQRAIAVSLSGVFYGMRFALPQMVAQRGGVIVNTASVSGLAADLHARCLQRCEGWRDQPHPHGGDRVRAKEHPSECGLSRKRRYALSVASNWGGRRAKASGGPPSRWPPWPSRGDRAWSAFSRGRRLFLHDRQHSGG